MLSLSIARRLPATPVTDYAAASAAYFEVQVASGEGGSTFPSSTVRDGRRIVGQVSYNGRVWTGEGDARRLVYCPGSAAVDHGRPDVFNEGRESVWGRKVLNPYATGSVEHDVFERGAAFARTCYAKAA